jgi:hypothetical protein
MIGKFPAEIDPDSVSGLDVTASVGVRVAVDVKVVVADKFVVRVNRLGELVPIIALAGELK